MQNLFPQHNGNSNSVVKCKMVFFLRQKRLLKKPCLERSREALQKILSIYFEIIFRYYIWFFKDTFIIITLNDFRKYNLKYFELSAFTNHFTILVTEKLFGIFENCCQCYTSNIFSIFIQISRPFPSHNTFELKPLLRHSSPISCENVLVLMRS